VTRSRITALLLAWGAAALVCVALTRVAAAASGPDLGADPELTAYIAQIRAVDNHSHANSIAPGDSDYDALPLDGIPITLPVQLQPENPDRLAAYKALAHDQA
jgi:hypothetical protein